MANWVEEYIEVIINYDQGASLSEMQDTVTFENQSIHWFLWLQRIKDKIVYDYFVSCTEIIWQVPHD